MFGIQEPAVDRIAAIVHDLDLKDDRFGAPEAGTVGALVDGLQLATAEDEVLLERGITLFESLYLSYAQAARPSGLPRGQAGRTSLARRHLTQLAAPAVQVERPRPMWRASGGGLARLCGAAFAAYCSYALCRTPLLPLFAQELGTAVPVSAKRLDELLRKIREEGAWQIQ